MPHKENTYRPPKTLMGIAMLFYVDDIRTLQETRLWASKACYGDSLTFYM
jgi:hypothetical protein